MNMMMTQLFLGMGAPPAGASGQGSSGMLMMGYMVIIFALFYFMMIRPQQKREKARRAMVDSLKVGDRVMFCGGMIGVVATVKDQALVIKVSETTKVEIVRGAVIRVLGKDEVPVDVDAK
jgi:preprotein translocase subunit YajC